MSTTFAPCHRYNPSTLTADLVRTCSTCGGDRAAPVVTVSTLPQRWAGVEPCPSCASADWTMPYDLDEYAARRGGGRRTDPSKLPMRYVCDTCRVTWRVGRPGVYPMAVEL